MAHQYSVEVRNAKLDAIETTIGASPTLCFRTGAAPAATVTANSGTVVATLALPADWLAAAAAGAKAKAGTWSDASADAGGTIGHYRIYDGAGLCHIQGSCSNTGDGGDMTLDNVVVNATQAVTVTGYTVTSGNA